MTEALAKTQPAEKTGSEEQDRRDRLWILTACLVAMLATMFTPPLLRMFSTEIWQSLGWREVDWSVFLAARGLFLILFILAAGAFGDLYGRRRVLLLSLLGYLAASLLAVAAPERDTFLLMTGLLPIFDAFIKTMTVTLVMVAFTGHARIYALVAYSTVYMVAFLLSPWFAAQTARAGQTADIAYAASIVLTLAGLLLVALKVPESRASVNLKPRDVAALCAWVAGVCAIFFAGVLAITLGWSHFLVLGTLAAGIATLLVLLWLQGKMVDDHWRVVIKFEGQLTQAVIAGIILNLALYAVTTQVFHFLQQFRGRNLLSAGLALAPILIGPVLLGAVAGRLTARVGARTALVIGLVLVGVAAAGFGLLLPDVPYWALAVFLALLGLGFIIGNAPYLILLSTSVPPDLEATVQAIGRTTSLMGSGLAYALILSLIAGFGRQAFVHSAEAAGLSKTAIQEQLSSAALAAGDFSLVLAPEAELQVLEWITPGLESAYTLGLGRAMLALALLCGLGAILVRIDRPIFERRKTKDRQPQ